jgi:hypothetical protein
MKVPKIAAIAAGIALILFTTNFIPHSASEKPAVDKTAPGKGFVVLELFTSEGCSSCPAADALLARIQAEAKDKPVYVLSYHVDYWDRLGWKDQFSSSQYSNRQVQYSHWLSSDVYTPQVVINGLSECVGSNESTIRNAIDKQLNTAAAATLVIEGRQTAKGADLQYTVAGSNAKDKLLIAVIQKHAVSSVKAGENQGRTLSHAQIVRELETIDVKQAKQGSTQLHLPAGFNPTDYEVIGLLQNSSNGQIDASTRVALKTS